VLRLAINVVLSHCDVQYIADPKCDRLVLIDYHVKSIIFSEPDAISVAVAVTQP